MNWFINLKTKTKLTLSFGIFLFILLFVAIRIYLVLNHIAENTENLYRNEFNLVENITKMDDDNNNIHRLLLVLLLNKNKSEIDNTILEMHKYIDEEDDKQEQISVSLKNDSLFLSRLEEFKKYKNELKRMRDEQILPAINAQDLTKAQTILISNYQPLFNKMSDLADFLTKEAKQSVEKAIFKSNELVQKSILFLTGMICVSIILSIILIIILNRQIAYPINEMSNLAKKIASGELNVFQHSSTIHDDDRQDEIGVLSQSFKIMVQNLKNMMKEISEVVNFLNASSTEIASAVSQLSASAAQTATSINETTSTIEEVKQTSQVASQKSKEVSESAQKTSAISLTGKKAAEEITDVINNINNQMSAISETMMRLNEQGQTIAAIITTVEDLAQQTNLLAVNAAIEASKAGEQGKGFSVVAHEIKSLANQSKQATAQVRSILTDIQKATSAAVMATELGTKAVESGVKKTDEAGATIISLINTVTEASHAASQIGAVTHQQLVGMEQAAIAMENIKEASGQNVDSTHQLKSSITQIKELGSRLKQLVSQYKLK